MDTVKNIAAILGVILSAASVVTLVSKRVRTLLSGVIRKYGNSDESEETISEIKHLLEQHIGDDKRFKEQMIHNNEITLEFTKTQCRNIIKNIFYKYNDTNVIPLYEKKTLMCIEELYINQMHCNSYASLLLEEMSDWEIDYNSALGNEFAES